MLQLRKDASFDLVQSISKLDKIKDYLFKYSEDYSISSLFLYNCNTIYEDIYSIDVKSFNIQFLIYINRFIKSNKIDLYITKTQALEKEIRVIEFGLFYKEVSQLGVNLNEYMVATRNIIFTPFFKNILHSSKRLRLFRLNYDDIEISTLEDDITVDLFVTKHFLDIVKLTHFDQIIVLNKKDGVYYIRNKKIVDIKYTSGWVNIPAYRHLIQLVVSFIINDNQSIDMLNKSITEYIEYADNDDFFGYEDDEISKSYDPKEIISTNIKYLFVAQVMSKFSILF